MSVKGRDQKMAAEGVKLEQSSYTNAILSGIYSDQKPLGWIIIVYSMAILNCEGFVLFGEVFSEISVNSE